MSTSDASCESLMFNCNLAEKVFLSSFILVSLFFAPSDFQVIVWNDCFGYTRSFFVGIFLNWVVCKYQRC